MTGEPLVLASGSPRRAEILDLIRIPFEVLPAEVEEIRLPDESPDVYAERLATEKARWGMRRRPGRHVLAGDTIVVLDGAILEKPVDGPDAVEMLLSLAGRTHEVLTGMALGTPVGEVHCMVARASVGFREFGAELAREYVQTGEPMDKAGAYGIQGRGAALVTWVHGDFYTVMGLSVAGLMDLFDQAGFPFRFGSDQSGA